MTLSTPPILFARRLAALLAALLFTAAAVAQSDDPAGPTWELRICAQPHNYPMSSRDRPGYGNRIAEILADELGAELSYHWTPFSDESMRVTLHRGACDAVVGIGESVSNVESSVPFLRAPYVFVSRTDRDLDVTSLDDPRLADLTVGTYQSGLPSIALWNRDLEHVLEEYAPLPSPSGPDRDTAILDAVIDGEVDIAIVYGPKAWARAQEIPGVLRIDPVTPETDIGESIIQMFRIWTVGVRPNDVTFQDRINTAMAARWDEIQSVIASYGVEGLEVPRPPVAAPLDADRARVGIVMPIPTLDHQPYEDVGEAAWRGVVQAENLLARNDAFRDVDFDILIASAPDDASTLRAAGRLVATEGIDLLAGGFTERQARDLAEIAASRGVAFLNIGVADDRLRAPRCAPTTFHVEASATMYLDAAVAWHAASGPHAWYLVVDTERYGAELADRFEVAVQRFDPGGTVTGVSATGTGQLVYSSEIDAIEAASPNVIVTALGADDEDQFLAQFDGRSDGATVTAVPDLRTQTRPFQYRLRQSGPHAATAARPVLWDAAFDDGEAGELNDAYASRNAAPMEAASWSAYAAVRIAFEAAAAGVANDVDELVAWFRDPGTTFDVAKGPGVSFRPWDHQLRQPLPVVRIDPEASWSNRVTPRVQFAEVLGTVPRDRDGGEEGRDDLDRIGRLDAWSTCVD